MQAKTVLLGTRDLAWPAAWWLGSKEVLVCYKCRIAHAPWGTTGPAQGMEAPCRR
jgi:hypothetical protein